MCNTCYRATNPYEVNNECCWSGLTEDGNPRLELPAYVHRNARGNFVSCDLYISDEDGKKRYAHLREDEGLRTKRSAEARMMDAQEVVAEIGYKTARIWL